MSCPSRREISDEAIYHLRKAGDALGDGKEMEPARAVLTATIEDGLIGTLKAVFRSVYVLPVSAQGQDYDKDQLPHPPNQKLSEFVFSVPAILALRGNKQPDASAQVQEQIAAE